MLEGGYVLFLVFRGDNTLPVYKKEFSPLHNRCLILLSKLLKEGCCGYWDNLYPSVEVAQEVARGGEYTATVPAGADAGATSTITVPPTGTSGTARTNRGVPSTCRQPDKKGLSEKAIADIKAKPIEERVKAQMTVSEPRVLCVSVFDNGPVHMLDTIHTSAGIITIQKPRYDKTTQTKVKLPLRILAIIDEYNHNMHYVDIRDHLAHEYNLDGSFWHDRKWWLPIWKELFKSACDQGYVMYKRICQIAEEKRVERVRVQRERAAAEARAEIARSRARKKPTDAEVAALVAVAEAKVPEGEKVKAMTHLDFLEKIAEGFVIEAYNSAKARDAQKMKLDAYDLQMIERALSEMRGDAEPSDGAQGNAATPQTAPTQSKKRNMMEAEVDKDGRLLQHELQGDAPLNGHALIDAATAIDLGLITSSHAEKSLYCSYKFCYKAAKNKAQKCGEGCQNEQKARALCKSICKHPRCKRGFHPTCWSKAHRLIE